MSEYQKSYAEEKHYLESVLNFLKEALEKEENLLEQRKDKLKEARRDMWEETVHFTRDFDRLTEINQHLVDINNQTAAYGRSRKLIRKYERILQSPYFGRFDFLEAGFSGADKIYIGLSNVMDPKTQNILVYDWRAPISSIFYRYELGKAAYEAPVGQIEGEVQLKRQYQIVQSQLKSFFDCNITINDEILQEVLSRNSSPRMRNIVETIQKEQDAIIRDSENELLIVQGVAGSGKTSVALHRIAYLLYLGMNSQLSSNNILILSPNSAFSKYISNVLPELGEENVEQMTLEELTAKCLQRQWKTEGRMQQLEYFISNRESRRAEIRRQSMEFKGSHGFTRVLDRLLHYFERRLVPFADIYYHGRVLETAQQLKNQFLHNPVGMPAAKRLERMENILMEKINPLRKERLKEIEKIVEKMGGHEFEIKSFSRLLSLKETKKLTQFIRRFTKIDFFQAYQRLFTEKDLFYRLSKGIALPEAMEQILDRTREDLAQGRILQEDSPALLYLKLKLEGGDFFTEIRQLFIDEAQDYSPLQYEIFKILFKDARYTVLGDVNQTLERKAENPFMDWVPGILGKKKTLKLFLNKGYRSSYEINRFNLKLLGRASEYMSFERHEEEPRWALAASLEELDREVARHIMEYRAQGFGTVAVISKTLKEAEEIHKRLQSVTDIALVREADEEIRKGPLIIPAYMAKGLEFDAVLIYNADKYRNDIEYDRKLLYVACTRALHRLVLFHTSEKGEFACWHRLPH